MRPGQDRVDALVLAEDAYLDARDLSDRCAVSAARGQSGVGDLAGRLAAALELARELVYGLERTGYRAADAHVVELMREWLDAAGAGDVAGAGNAAEGDGATRELADRYARAQASVWFDGAAYSRLEILDQLGWEPDPSRRQRLFLALRPVWHAMAADGAPGGGYRGLVARTSRRWAAHGSPVAASAAAAGFDPDGLESALRSVLQHWRESIHIGPDASLAPWDFWYEYGAAARIVRPAVPYQRLRRVSDAYHAALGADVTELGVGFDLVDRPGRPAVAVAFTEFGGRPRRLGPDVWRRARPWVFANHRAGGLGELTELMHETGHAIHLAALRTRPAFADWPDSDAFTEGLGELTALDTAEPAWQRHWLGVAAPETLSIRGRYADVMLDFCWALFEIVLYADPDRDPDQVWAELTRDWLGVATPPGLPWWAMRGQLVTDPGYLVNYALAAMVAVALRAAIRHERGDWIYGDPGWYDWVSARLYRYGRERGSADVLGAVLGGPVGVDGLLAEVARAAGPPGRVERMGPVRR